MAARASIRLKKAGVESTPTVLETASSPQTSLEDRIRIKAYEFYLDRNGQDGSELDDWLRAETELTHTVEQNYHQSALDTASDETK